MRDDITSNPFSACTARDMGYEEVFNYWCNPFKMYGLSERELFDSMTPIVIEGARGTGKTMILKYLSYWNQKRLCEKNSENLRSHLERTGIGLYYRYKADFSNMLSETPLQKNEDQIVFLAYFNLFLSRELAGVLCDFSNEEAIDYYQFYDEVGRLLSARVESLDDVPRVIRNQIEELDNAINNAISEVDWKRIVVIAKQFTKFFKACINVLKEVPEFESIRFIILIDEYENAHCFQKSINTLIKQTDSDIPITYRIGMRPRGMENNGTFVAEERLQPDRDFYLRPLKFTDLKTYRQFAKDVSKKRLQKVQLFEKNNLTDICKILGRRENFDDEAKDAADDEKMFDFLFSKKPFLLKNRNQVIKAISNDNKLIQMYNILLLLRDKENDYKKIGEMAESYLHFNNSKRLNDSEEDVKKYKLGYCDKYRLSLLFLIIKICGSGGKPTRKKYYSFNTFVFLSTGSINDYISLCRNTFNLISSEDFSKLCSGNPINPNIQTEAAIQTATDQMKKLGMSQYYGKKLYTFVNNMGNLFRYYQEDESVRYPETNQFAFENQSQIIQNEKLNAYLVELINTGAIVEKENQQHITIGKRRGDIYWLSRIYSPKYQFSYRTRGGYNHILSEEDFSKMLQRDVDPKELAPDLNAKKVKRSKTKGQNNNSETDDGKELEQIKGQMTLWDYSKK